MRECYFLLMLRFLIDAVFFFQKINVRVAVALGGCYRVIFMGLHDLYSDIISSSLDNIPRVSILQFSKSSKARSKVSPISIKKDINCFQNLGVCFSMCLFGPEIMVQIPTDLLLIAFSSSKTIIDIISTVSPFRGIERLIGTPSRCTGFLLGKALPFGIGDNGREADF